MSRRTFLHSSENKITVSYGLDHACGYFIQVLDESGKEDVVLCDVDTFFQNKDIVAQEMERWGVPEKVIKNMILDLPI
jgi:hypothetical protein